MTSTNPTNPGEREPDDAAGGNSQPEQSDSREPEQSDSREPELDETGMPPDAVTTGGTTDADVSDGSQQ